MTDGFAGLAGAVIAADEDDPGATAAGGVGGPEGDGQAAPGAGEHQMSLAEGLRAGGARVFWVLLLLDAVDQLESAGLSVLAPDIRDSFGLSDGAITVLTAATGAFIAIGAVPMGWLADRVRRRAPMIGASGIAFGLAVFASGLAPTAFAFFCARFGAGIATSTSLPVHGSFLADTYPIGVRGRMAATTAVVGRALAGLSPLLVGLIAAAAGGDEGWRWPFLVLSLPTSVVALWAFLLREPVRGRWEKQDVVGPADAADEAPPALVSMEAAFARLAEVRTLRSVILGFSTLGFGILMVPVLSNLYLEDRFGASAVGRGAVTTAASLAGLAVLPFVGRSFDAAWKQGPARAVRAIGYLVLPIAVLAPVQYAMPNIVLFAIAGMVPSALLTAAFVMLRPLIQSVVPYQLRGLGLSLMAIYVFCIGAMGGALITLPLTNSFGPRTSILAVLVPASLVGGLLFVRSASSVDADLAQVIAELTEERAELDRQAARPDDVPALQVSGVDVSYGPVQVLFDVGFEVRDGEVLALLGTNGAGKSTLLDVVTGLRTPSRGVVRHRGRTITFTSPEQRAARGIHSLAGGKATFPALSVADNLEVAGILLRRDHARAAARRDEVLALFPDVAARLDQRAGDLSGGQQQQLGLAMTLLHEPDVLVIDELSLGLSPTMVADLLAVIDRLRAAGQTMVIVEQSLNVALAVSDRAVFLEKGQVRFSGPSHELAARDDLARAVFLGLEGG